MHVDGWTLLLQAINLGILVALLRWLFYRPLLAVIDARRAAIDAEAARSAAAQARTESREKALDESRAALDASREAVLQAARAEAEQLRLAGGEQARGALESALEEGRRRLAQERRDASSALQDEAAALATALASRLLSLVALPDGDAPFVQALVDRVLQAPAPDRDAWFAPDQPRVATLATAHAQTAPQQDAIRDRLRQRLGDDLRLDFVTDPALIAGAELRMAHGVLALSWAGELARARASMRTGAVEAAA